jgi:hypothetical protein
MTGRSRRARALAVALRASAVVVACGALASCGGSPAESPAGPATTPSPSVPAEWPLTGVVSDAVVPRPALGVKIENSPQARPQVGLMEADVVWEEVVEGGIARFLAVYHSRIPEAVGPVRSVRPMDPAIVAPLGGILAYSGAQQPFVDAVEASGTQSVIMDRGDPGFARDPERRRPHDVVGVPEAFLEQADDERTVPPPEQFAFAPDVGAGTAAREGTPAARLDVVLSGAQRTVWDWDAGAGMWLRSEDSTPSVSASGERHAARNVVMLSVEVVDTPFRDPVGAPVPDTVLVASGTGIVASGGRTVEVAWSKAALDVPLALERDGRPVELDPGSTWVELVPRDGGRWDVS